MTGPGNGSSGVGAAPLTEDGRLLHRAGRLDDAERLYRQALALEPEHAEAHHLLAVLAGQRGNIPGAIAGFRRAIELAGPSPERCYNLAEAHRLAGDFQSALAAYNQALAIDPDYVDAYRDCADAARESAAAARRGGNAAAAERLDGLAAHYLIGLGHAHARADRLAEADRAYREALPFAPENAELLNALGVLAHNASREFDAEALLRRAIAANPAVARYHNNLGAVLMAQVRIDEAAVCFRRALQLDPGLEDARANLEERLLLQLHYRADMYAEMVAALHKDWGALALTRANAVGPAAPFANSRDPARRLRIGYVSGDFRDHAVRFFLEPLLARHDPAAVEVFAYSDVRKPDAVTARFRGLVAHWRDTLGIADRDVAAMMREDAIDILIDLAGHTGSNRLGVFALKPAPVTATWLGYPATTGLSNLDYRITDAIVDPPGPEEALLHSERLYRLPEGFLCYRPPAEAPPVAPLPAASRGFVTFGSFNNPMKSSYHVVELWSEILREVPGSRLLLKGLAFADAELAKRFLANFEAFGVAPERVTIMAITRTNEESLRLYGEIDIGLDPFPYNGTTTTCDALWMGVPVVAFNGDRHAARVGADLLTRVGLADLIADSRRNYAEKAVALAGDLDRLGGIRAGLRERMRRSSLCDEPGFARQFEAALREMWQRWCAAG
ncbi:MAG TPA: tetratricopeptide repeat protein [Stellaceae bacterium]|nr:tetratricopeptide repeat protein [Stellaceae bacterium]